MDVVAVCPRLFYPRHERLRGVSGHASRHIRIVAEILILPEAPPCEGLVSAQKAADGTGGRSGDFSRPERFLVDFPSSPRVAEADEFRSANFTD